MEGKQVVKVDDTTQWKGAGYSFVDIAVEVVDDATEDPGKNTVLDQVRLG